MFGGVKELICTPIHIHTATNKSELCATCEIRD